MEFNNKSHGEVIHSSLKSEQKCQVDEAEKGQKLFNTSELSCLSTEHQDKPYTSIVPSFLPIWASRSPGGHGALGRVQLQRWVQLCVHQIRGSAPKQSPCQMGPSTSPLAAC